jgi:hypothetical protein
MDEVRKPINSATEVMFVRLSAYLNLNTAWIIVVKPDPDVSRLMCISR